MCIWMPIKKADEEVYPVINKNIKKMKIKEDVSRKISESLLLVYFERDREARKSAFTNEPMQIDLLYKYLIT